ncbi:hypothetical protein AVEN_76045-1, partial [Araneus ventricosus]
AAIQPANSVIDMHDAKNRSKRSTGQSIRPQATTFSGQLLSNTGSITCHV